MKGCWILSNAFSASNAMIICFFFQFIYMIKCIDRFCICRTILASLGWRQLDHSGWFFLCVLRFSLTVFFFEYFCIYIHEGNCSLILFLGWISVWFWYQGNCSLIKRTWLCSFCFYYVEHLEEYRYYLFFEALVEFCTETIWPWDFIGWESVDNCFYFLACYRSIVHLVLI